MAASRATGSHLRLPNGGVHLLGAVDSRRGLAASGRRIPASRGVLDLQMSFEIRHIPN